MFGSIVRSAPQAAALARIEAWVRERFALQPQEVVLVSELACQLPGCPPLETVIAFWTADTRRHHYKVFKPAQQVQADDLPPYWMKDALAVAPDDACECC